MSDAKVSLIHPDACPDCNTRDIHTEACPRVGTCGQYASWWVPLEECHPESEWLAGSFTNEKWRVHMQEKH